jgi:hypothetical protein
VAGSGGWKSPPAGVPAEPDRSRSYVSLSEAAQRLGVDRRTLLRAVTSGVTAGWARPGPDNLRWYVYEDALVSAGELGPGSPPGRLDSDVARERIARLEAENAELRARLMNASESNLLLIAAQEDLAASANLLSSAADKYRQALSLYMTPDHIGDLTHGVPRSAVVEPPPGA